MNNNLNLRAILSGWGLMGDGLVGSVGLNGGAGGGGNGAGL